VTRPLRIGLIVQGGRNWMGGIEYIKNIIFALGSLPLDVRSTFEVRLICAKDLESVQSEVSAYVRNTYFFDDAQVPQSLPGLIRWGISKAVFGQGNPTLIHALNQADLDFAYPSLARLRWTRHFRSAAWVPDCQHKYLPQLFTHEDIEGRDRFFAFIAKHASVVVFSSKTAETDFKTFFRKSTYKSEILSFRVSPLPEWYRADPLAVQQAYNLPDRFLLVSNQFWQHKNHAVIFKALKILQGQGVHPAIVCTGCLYDYRQPSFLDETLQTVHILGLANQVYLLGVVKRLDMISLMRRALAVVQPSLFEGWSTVVEEARSLGKPIILSDIPVHREQDPPHSTFFVPVSAEHLAIALADAWQRLTPGPHPIQEAIARDAGLPELQAFGHRFLQIARGGHTPQ